MPKQENESEDFATIESIVHDQGGGSSCCSACETKIDIFNLKKNNGELYSRCPGCKKQLSFGNTFINVGGSDF